MERISSLAKSRIDVTQGHDKPRIFVVISFPRAMAECKMQLPRYSSESIFHISQYTTSIIRIWRECDIVLRCQQSGDQSYFHQCQILAYASIAT